jgi:hypothetical protein
MENANVVKENEVSLFNYDKFIVNLKSNLIAHLSYNNEAAEDQAKRIADIFNEAYSI